MKKIMLMLMLSLFMISFVSGAQDSLGTFEARSDVNIVQMCENCDSIILSAIVYPNSTVAVSNVSMITADNFYYNYTLDGDYTDAIGTYTVNGYDSGDSVFAFDLEVTENGEAVPSPEVIIVFSLLFFVVFAFIVWSFINVLAKFTAVEMNGYDVIYSLISYIGFLMYYYFANIYFPKEFILGLLETFIYVGGFINIVLPLIGLIFSWIKGGTAE